MQCHTGGIDNPKNNNITTRLQFGTLKISNMKLSIVKRITDKNNIQARFNMNVTLMCCFNTHFNVTWSIRNCSLLSNVNTDHYVTNQHNFLHAE